VLRTLLPLYQAITTVQIRDGTTSSFWYDVWSGDDAFTDRFPVLFSHCANKDITVQQATETALAGNFVRQLSV
jgi:hypothetical protein